jgi:hypothetical protein
MQEIVLEANFSIIDDGNQITPAPPMWEDDEIWITPAYFGTAPSVFDPNAGVPPQRRTLRQRMASARQSIRNIARTDMEWVRGAMASAVGIRSQAERTERTGAGTAQPSSRNSRTNAQGNSSRNSRTKPQGNYSMNLRGGSDTPDPRVYDSGSEVSPSRPPLPRPPPLRQTLRRTEGSLNELRPIRPAEYIHPLARDAHLQTKRRSTERGDVPAAASDVADRGSCTRQTSRNSQGAQQSVTPISEALLEEPMPEVKNRRSFSKFGRETGTKIKEKFSTLGRKRKLTEQADPEPEIAVREEVYATTSGTGRFQMWPFGKKKKKADVTTYF